MTSQLAMRRRSAIPASIIAIMCTQCGSTPAEDATSGTSEAMSSTIHTVYGVTSFGGPGDYQSLACGGNSRTVNPWYVASSQRYGCNKHLRLVANGKCLVVYTGDAGPATFVETNAGIAVLDASPSVGKFLFGDGSLGWSDIKAHPGKYEVHVTTTTLPLGPCDGSGSGGGTTGGGGGTTGGGGGTTGGGGGGSTGGGGGAASCAADGDCNPGNDGSGQICESGACVPGCHRDSNCPGVTTCVAGTCR